MLVSGHALACPDNAAKNAMAPASAKVVAVAPAAKSTGAAPASKAVNKVAVKPAAAAEPRKTASL
jgi:hypothetical protein